MAIMDTPKELNGFPVVRVEQHKNCSTVMIGKPGEYVVATWWPDLKTTWMWGHYFMIRMGDVETAYRDATKDFNTTASFNTTR